MIAREDADGDGAVDFSEFLAYMGPRLLNMSPDSLIHNLFHAFDTNGNGFISAGELQHGMAMLGQKYSDQEIDKLIACGDMDGDGKLTLREFSKLFMY